LLDLSYPVDALLLGIRHNGNEESDIVSNAVSERTRRSRIRRSSLPKPKKVFLAVHRQEDTVYFKRLQQEAFGVLIGLQQGKPLSEAIAGSVDWTSRKVETITVRVHDWFANWAALGWLCPSEGGA
jgi:hypothetical protein